MIEPYDTLGVQATQELDEALLRQALEALEYAADITDPQTDPCRCRICVASEALRERLGEKT